MKNRLVEVLKNKGGLYQQIKSKNNFNQNPITEKGTIKAGYILYIISPVQNFIRSYHQK